MGSPAGLVSPGLYLGEQVWLTRHGVIGPAREQMRRKASTRPIVRGAKRRTPRSRSGITRPMVMSVADRSRPRVIRRSTRATTAEAGSTEGQILDVRR